MAISKTHPSRDEIVVAYNLSTHIGLACYLTSRSNDLELCRRVASLVDRVNNLMEELWHRPAQDADRAILLSVKREFEIYCKEHPEIREAISELGAVEFEEIHRLYNAELNVDAIVAATTHLFGDPETNAAGVSTTPEGQQEMNRRRLEIITSIRRGTN